jgi:hypothetical protein
LEALFDENQAREASAAAAARGPQTGESTETARYQTADTSPDGIGDDGSSQDGRTPRQDLRPMVPGARPITRIVATRMTTTRSGDPND